MIALDHGAPTSELLSMQNAFQTESFTFVELQAQEGLTTLVNDLNELVKSIASELKSAPLTKVLTGEGALPGEFFLREVASHTALGPSVVGFIRPQMINGEMTPALVNALEIAVRNEASSAYNESLARSIIAYVASLFNIDEAVILALPNAVKTYLKQDDFTDFTEDIKYLVMYFALVDNQANQVQDRVKALQPQVENPALRTTELISQFASNYKVEEGKYDILEILDAFGEFIMEVIPDPVEEEEPVEEVAVEEVAVDEQPEQELPDEVFPDENPMSVEIEDSTVIKVGDISIALQHKKDGEKSGATLLITVDLHTPTVDITQE